MLYLILCCTLYANDTVMSYCMCVCTYNFSFIIGPVWCCRPHNTSYCSSKYSPCRHHQQHGHLVWCIGIVFFIRVHWVEVFYFSIICWVFRKTFWISRLNVRCIYYPHSPKPIRVHTHIYTNTYITQRYAFIFSLLKSVMHILKYMQLVCVCVCLCENMYKYNEVEFLKCLQYLILLLNRRMIHLRFKHIKWLDCNSFFSWC